MTLLLYCLKAFTLLPEFFACLMALVGFAAGKQFKIF